VLVDFAGLRILVDAGPDFREQMLRADVSHLDAILFTHSHRDHTGGLDDVRSLNYVDRSAAEVYCEQSVLDSLRLQYAYAFAEKLYPGAPILHVHLIDEDPFVVDGTGPKHDLVWIHDKGYCYKMPDGSLLPTGGGTVMAREEETSLEDALAWQTGDGSPMGRLGPRRAAIIPIRGYHDKMPVLGFRFGNIAYITDMSRLPESELPKLEGLDHVTLNTVGYNQHHSHFSLYEALDVADKIGAKHTWLTHLSHTFPTYDAFVDELRRLCAERNVHSEVLPAYDGLVIE
jgi:phosphoribosyl 1,2-cyclic phosphate phosphodiesterase